MFGIKLRRRVVPVPVASSCPSQDAKGPCMKILAAAIQMASEPLQVAANVDRADALLHRAHLQGASLAVLPEMFNTGYGLIPDYAPMAEDRDGPTVRHLLARSREWEMAIAAGFVERDGHHLYDSVLFATPDGKLRSTGSGTSSSGNASGSPPGASRWWSRPPGAGSASRSART